VLQKGAVVARGYWNPKRRPPSSPTLNSARRHCTPPRRRRLIEWSNPRRRSQRLHLRARRICWRCACDASNESVGNARSIDETTSDGSLVTDSVKRCKGRPGVIECEEIVWRDKEESMSHACTIRISANHPVPIVKSKQDCRNGARRIDREVQRPIRVPVVAVKDS
jgi:hypothetical protein